jgi:cytochrome P450
VLTHLQVRTVPHALPLVGHAGQLLLNPLGYLEAQHVLAPVVRLLLGHREWYVVTDLDAALQVLVSEQQHFDKGGPLMEMLRLLAGNGIGTCNAEDHRLQRPMMQPAFHRRQVAGYVEVMRRCVLEVTSPWAHGDEVAISEDMYRMAALIIARTLIAAPAGKQAADVMAVMLPRLLRGLLRRMLVPVSWVHRIPTPANRRFTAARAELDAAIDDVIDQYRAGEQDQRDLLSQIMTGAQDGGRRPDDRELRDQVMSVLLAGVETTASLLTWTFHLLARHPAVEQKLWAELDTVLCDRVASFDDLARLPYTKQVLTEVLRLYPPTWILSRVALPRATIAGFALPEGADVVISPYALHRNPDVFPDPDAFEPDRWLPERVTARQRQSFLAFGAGRRRCIGELFGMTEATLALAMISSTWRLRPTRPGPARPLTLLLLIPAIEPLLLQRRATPQRSTGQ